MPHEPLEKQKTPLKTIQEAKAEVTKNPERPLGPQSPETTHFRAMGNMAAQRMPEDSTNQTPSTSHVRVMGNQAAQARDIYDFSDVRIHKDSASAVRLGALAYTQGNNIHFAPGQYKPHTTEGKRIINHELGHVIQQRLGVVRPTTSIEGLPVNDEPLLENNADFLGVEERGNVVYSRPWTSVIPNRYLEQRPYTMDMRIKSMYSKRCRNDFEKPTENKSAGGTESGSSIGIIQMWNLKTWDVNEYFDTEEDINEKCGNDSESGKLLIKSRKALDEFSKAVTNHQGMDYSDLLISILNITKIIDEYIKRRNSVLIRLRITKKQKFLHTMDITVQNLIKEINSEDKSIRMNSFRQVAADRKAEIDRIQEIIVKKKNYGTLLERNSMEYIDEQPLPKVYVVTATGDTNLRYLLWKKTTSQPEGQEKKAYFPDPFKESTDIKSKSDQSYNCTDSADNNNIWFYRWTVAGASQAGKKLILLDTKEKADDEVVSTIVHEVQHDADKHLEPENINYIRGNGADKAQKNAVEESIARYRSEYRAYYYCGLLPLGSLQEGGNPIRTIDDLIQGYEVTEGVDSLKSEMSDMDIEQAAIFLTIYLGYPYVKICWDKNYKDGTDTEFRKLVRDFVITDDNGFNRMNSIRVDIFYNALAGLGWVERGKGEHYIIVKVGDIESPGGGVTTKQIPPDPTPFDWGALVKANEFTQQKLEELLNKKEQEAYMTDDEEVSLDEVEADRLEQDFQSLIRLQSWKIFEAALKGLTFIEKLYIRDHKGYQAMIRRHTTVEVSNHIMEMLWED
jgi:hypothetical protein